MWKYRCQLLFNPNLYITPNSQEHPVYRPKFLSLCSSLQGTASPPGSAGAPQLTAEECRVAPWSSAGHHSLLQCHDGTALHPSAVQRWMHQTG